MAPLPEGTICTHVPLDADDITHLKELVTEKIAALRGDAAVPVDHLANWCRRLDKLGAISPPKTRGQKPTAVSSGKASGKKTPAAA